MPIEFGHCHSCVQSVSAVSLLYFQKLLKLDLRASLKMLAAQTLASLINNRHRFTLRIFEKLACACLVARHAEVTGSPNNNSLMLFSCSCRGPTRLGSNEGSPVDIPMKGPKVTPCKIHPSNGFFYFECRQKVDQGAFSQP